MSTKEINAKHDDIPVIKLDNVSAAVGGNVVVSGVSFEIPARTKLAIVGTNGAGKSTLLRAMAGITAPAAGSIKVGEDDIHKMNLRKRAQIISFVSQEDTPPADLTLAEMVCLGRIPHRPPWAVNENAEHDIVEDALAQVGLGDRLESSCDHLSGGERRRAMLARGLAQNCPILMLDEPTNHLDIAWTLRLLKLLSELDETVIAVIHDLDLVLRNFDLVAVLHNHRLHSFGKPADVINSELLAEAFNVEAVQAPHPETGRPHLLISKGKEVAS